MTSSFSPLLFLILEKYSVNSTFEELQSHANYHEMDLGSLVLVFSLLSVAQKVQPIPGAVRISDFKFPHS